MNRQIVAAALVAALSVSGAGYTYYLTADRPVTVQTPTIVYVDEPCGDPDAAGCYDKTRPNEVQIGPHATPATLPHELLHFEAHRNGIDLSECQVSHILEESTGLQDGYARSGFCEDGKSTGKSPRELD